MSSARRQGESLELVPAFSAARAMPVSSRPSRPSHVCGSSARLGRVVSPGERLTQGRAVGEQCLRWHMWQWTRSASFMMGSWVSLPYQLRVVHFPLGGHLPGLGANVGIVSSRLVTALARCLQET